MAVSPLGSLASVVQETDFVSLIEDLAGLGGGPEAGGALFEDNLEALILGRRGGGPAEGRAEDSWPRYE